MPSKKENLLFLVYSTQGSGKQWQRVLSTKYKNKIVKTLTLLLQLSYFLLVTVYIHVCWLHRWFRRCKRKLAYLHVLKQGSQNIPQRKSRGQETLECHKHNILFNVNDAEGGFQVSCRAKGSIMVTNKALSFV